MKEKGKKYMPWLLVVCALLIGGITLGISTLGQEKAGAARGEMLDAAKDQVVTEENCVLVQTFRFVPCAHQVTRRLTLPDELVGADFDTVLAHYDNWQVDTFSAEYISMSRDENIYCPMHLVLMPDEAGKVCVFRNVYGDGMAFEEETDYAMDVFDEDTQAQLFSGIGFESEEDLMRWLRSRTGA